MTDASTNPHFRSVKSLSAASRELAFVPVVPTSLPEPSLIRLFVRDHKQRELPITERSLEIFYDSCVVTQQRAASHEDARSLALERSYGSEPIEADVSGRKAMTYELGPEVPEDDVDGRSAAVVAWAVGDVFHLVASTSTPVAALLTIARSIPFERS